jgi:glycosyltransferase involved in cell wall biosynthesis
LKVLLSAYACIPGKGSEPGNGWKWAYYLSKKEFEVYVITTSKGRSEIDEVLRNYQIKNIKVHYVDHSKFWSKAYYWNFITMYMAYFLWQRKILRTALCLNREVNFDLIHHVTWGSLKIGSFLYNLKKPMVFGPVGGGQKAPLHFKEYLANDFKKEKLRNKISFNLARFNPLTKTIIKKCKVLVTNQDTLDFVNQLGCKSAELVFDAAIEENNLPKYLAKSDNGKFELLWIGRIYDFKGLRLILAALNKIPEDKLNKIALTILGDGPGMAGVKSEIDDNRKLKDCIVLKGFVPYGEIANYYKKADAFIFTSLRDSFPSQILEAMSWSLPIITLDLHGQSMMVNSKNGIKCSINDPRVTVNELSDAIQHLSENHTLRIRLGKNAYEFASGQTWNKKVSDVVSKFYPTCIN